MTSLRNALFAALAASALSGPAAAQDVVSAAEPQRVLEVVQAFGQATLSKSRGGDPQIQGQIGRIPVWIDFFNCEQSQNCRYVIFSTAFRNTVATADSINRWNLNAKFGRASIDPRGNATLEMPVNLFGGVTRSNFDDTVEWWSVIAENFRDYVYGG